MRPLRLINLKLRLSWFLPPVQLVLLLALLARALFGDLGLQFSQIIVTIAACKSGKWQQLNLKLAKVQFRWSTCIIKVVRSGVRDPQRRTATFKIFCMRIQTYLFSFVKLIKLSYKADQFFRVL